MECKLDCMGIIGSKLLFGFVVCFCSINIRLFGHHDLGSFSKCPRGSLIMWYTQPSM